MHIDQMFPGNFMKASDLEGTPRTVRIAGLKHEELGGERKYLITFRGDKSAFPAVDKAMVLNKTNARVLAKAYGDSDDWIGKPVTLFEAQVDFRGDMVPAIRLRIPQQQRAAQPVRQHVPQDVVPDLDEDIPF